MTITEAATYLRDHPYANEETAPSMAITQRLHAIDDPIDAPVAIDPVAEEEHWARHYALLPYVQPGEPYSRFRAAFRFGWEARAAFPDKTWGDVQNQLMADWEGDPANYDFPWTRARPAVREAWDRLTPR